MDGSLGGVLLALALVAVAYTLAVPVAVLVAWDLEWDDAMRYGKYGLLLLLLIGAAALVLHVVGMV